MKIDPERFTLANRRHLYLFLGVLVFTGGMCPKCGYGTRYTSKRWAVCKRCGHRCARRELPSAGGDAK